MTASLHYVLLNPNSGTALAQGITAEMLGGLFAEAGIDAIIDADDSLPMSDRIAAALASPAPTIVAAGGDGTITALAGALAGTERQLAILPLGTVNALAKDLHVPLDLPAAIAALATGQPHRIDVGEVNGRVFLHKVVIGVIPALAAGREHIRGRESAWAARIGFLRFLVRRLTRTRRMAVAISTPDGGNRVERVQALAVASNSYDEGLGRFFARGCLDGGTLTLYVLRHLTPGDMLRLATGMLLGHWRDDEALHMETVTEITITTKKPTVKVMFDGEVESLPTPLRFTIRPGALAVLVPADAPLAAEPA